MGIYDRPYYQEDEQRGIFLGGGGAQMMVTKIVLINVGIFIIDALFLSERVQLPTGKFLTIGTLSDLFAVSASTLTEPLYWWRFLTYGFVHAPGDITHVAFNMLVLWFLGRELERKYGAAEFLRFYLVAIVVSGIAFAVIERLLGHPLASAYGASGAVYAVVIAFAMNFPKVTVLLFFAIPVPAWFLGALYIVLDVFKMISPGDGPKVAHTAHFAGAAFAFLYCRFGWNLAWLTPKGLTNLKLRRGPKLRIHDPDSRERDLSRQVDQILEKISREGEDSLTRKERQILQKASREYQEKKRG